MSEMHLRQPGFTYSACRPFTKNEERIKRLKKTGDSQYIQNETDKACVQHDMGYGELKNLPRRTVSDKILHYKVFNIAKNAKYYGYQIGLASVVYKLFYKRSSGCNTTNGAIKSKIMSDQELDKKLNKPII